MNTTFAKWKLIAGTYVLASLMLGIGCNKKDDGGEPVAIGPNAFVPACANPNCAGINPNAVLLSNVTSTEINRNFELQFNVAGTGIPAGEYAFSSYSGPIIFRGNFNMATGICGIPAGTYAFDTIDAAQLASGTAIPTAGAMMPGALPGMRMFGVGVNGIRIDFRLVPQNNSYGGNYGGSYGGNYGGSGGALGLFLAGSGGFVNGNPNLRFQTTATFGGQSHLVIDFVSVPGGGAVPCGQNFTLQ